MNIANVPGDLSVPPEGFMLEAPAGAGRLRYWFSAIGSITARPSSSRRFGGEGAEVGIALHLPVAGQTIGVAASMSEDFQRLLGDMQRRAVWLAVNERWAAQVEPRWNRVELEESMSPLAALSVGWFRVDAVGAKLVVLTWAKS